MGRLYLGTDLDPHDYYRQRADSYDNPHAPGIRHVLDRHMHHLKGVVLDMGCGSGLATMVLWSRPNEIIGVDSEPAMIERYERETEHKGVVANFWDALPPAESAVFVYSLHLCPDSWASMVAYRLVESGVRHVIVVSPFKPRAENWPQFQRINETAEGVGPDEKTIYGRVYVRDDLH